MDSRRAYSDCQKCWWRLHWSSVPHFRSTSCWFWDMLQKHPPVCSVVDWLCPNSFVPWQPSTSAGWWCYRRCFHQLQRASLAGSGWTRAGAAVWLARYGRCWPRSWLRETGSRCALYWWILLDFLHFSLLTSFGSGLRWSTCAFVPIERGGKSRFRLIWRRFLLPRENS